MDAFHEKSIKLLSNLNLKQNPCDLKLLLDEFFNDLDRYPALLTDDFATGTLVRVLVRTSMRSQNRFWLY